MKQGVMEGLVDIDFVNAQDGYLFVVAWCSVDCLLLTHDAGRTWRSTALPETGQVVNGADSVYALVATHGHQRVKLFRNTPGRSQWTRLDLSTLHVVTDHPNDVGFTIAADGDTIALLQLGRTNEAPVGAHASEYQRGALWISTKQGAQWQQRTNPCTSSDGGAALVSVALDHPEALLLDCYNGEQSSQEQVTQHHLYGSGDDGRTWNRLADPSGTGGPELLADNGEGHAFLVSAGGFGYQLHVSLDGAAHWHTVLDGGAGGFGMGDLRFLSPEVGYALGPTHYSPEHLYRTENAGKSWKQLPTPGP